MSILVNGTLYKFLEGGGSEDIYYETDIPAVNLGAAGHPVAYSTEFNLPFDSGAVTNALLDIAVSVSDPRSSRWKVSFGDVVVTREFKPMSCIKFRGDYYCKMVYNVKPIIISKSTRSLKAVIRHLGGNEIRVHHIGLLVTAREDGAESMYMYMSGFVELKPGESYHINLPRQMSDRFSLRFVAAFPEAGKAYLRIGEGEHHLDLRGVGVKEYDVNISGTSTLTFTAVGNESILLSSLLFYKLHAPKPRIEVSVNSSGGSLKVRVRNTGDRLAESVIVNSISLGVVVDRKMVGNLKPGEEAEVMLKYNPGSINTIRVIWRYRGLTEFKDVKLKL